VRFPSRIMIVLSLLFALFGISFQTYPQLPGRVNQALLTPLAAETMALLANEISGQMAFDNQVKLAGAPWLRDSNEFSGTLYESRQISELVHGYGIETTRLERYPAPGSFDYAHEGEFWLLAPERRLIARLGADAALVAQGSVTADVTGELVYIAPLGDEEIKRLAEAGPQEKYRGKLALMWAHARGEAAKALDAAGIQGVISFSAQDRYLDPNQVIYSSGQYAGYQNLKLGMTISWRQWTELLEDLGGSQKVVVRARTRVGKYPNKYEAVYSWIPGREPQAKGVVFTAHLFEGYTKRGANDDMSGCVIQLEILRALNKLIAAGQLPQPRRTLHFLWPNEISGTYEFIKQHPGFADKASININMDMVGEGLRKNNALFTMSECPGHLPSYLDGLAKSIMNFVWRTNDIVYLPDAPRGRPRGQNFPVPMIEKNGSTDAFRFFIHRATGGSDHICFNNSSVAVPGIEFFVWPDQWYHSDGDTPDKGDPTEMKRVAFIGAAVAWAAANCTDDVVAGLAEAASSFGYGRIAEREIPRAQAHIERAEAKNLSAETARALNLVEYGAQREIGALRSIEEIYTGSTAARAVVANRVQQWNLYRAALRDLVMGYARIRAAQLGSPVPAEPAGDAVQAKYQSIRPALVPTVMGREFQVSANEQYSKYLKETPEALKSMGITAQQAAAIVNNVNARRSVTDIRNAVAAELDEDVPLNGVILYLELLRKIRWVVF
jgi:aminopeptidase YwaD